LPALAVPMGGVANGFSDTKIYPPGHFGNIGKLHKVKPSKLCSILYIYNIFKGVARIRSPSSQKCKGISFVKSLTAYSKAKPLLNRVRIAYNGF